MTRGPRIHVRQSGVTQYVEVWEFDLVPCRMRMSIPGTSRFVNPVPGRPDGVERNADILVWCDCMAQTPAQLDRCRDIRAGFASADDPWPEPRLQRGWDVLGAVRSILDGTTGSHTRGRRSNPDAPGQARKMWDDHVAERRARIARRGGAQ